MKRTLILNDRIIQLLFLIFTALDVKSQSGFVSTGASSIDPVKGAISYSIGEVGYVNSKSQGGTIDIGIQQSFQFSPINALPNIEYYNDILIYPNPTNGTLYIKNLPQQLINHGYYFKILSSEGNELKSEMIKNTTTTVDLIFLPKGLYHMIIYSGNRLIKKYNFLKL